MRAVAVWQARLDLSRTNTRSRRLWVNAFCFPKYGKRCPKRSLSRMDSVAASRYFNPPGGEPFTWPKQYNLPQKNPNKIATRGGRAVQVFLLSTIRLKLQFVGMHHQPFRGALQIFEYAHFNSGRMQHLLV